MTDFKSFSHSETQSFVNSGYQSRNCSAAAAFGYIFIAFHTENKIGRFSTEGLLNLIFGESGSGPGQLDGPEGISAAVNDSESRVYVADTRNNRIESFDIDGNYVAQQGSSGSGNGQFDAPLGLVAYGTTATPTSDVWVVIADSNNNRLQVLRGDDLSFWGAGGTSGSAEGAFDNPIDVAASSTGTWLEEALYVLDKGNYRVQKLRALAISEGKLAYIVDVVFGSSGYSDGQFLAPSAITAYNIDSTLHVAVSDYLRGDVQIFGATGNFITKTGAFVATAPKGLAHYAELGTGVSGIDRLYATREDNLTAIFNSDGYVAKWFSYPFGGSSTYTYSVGAVCVGSS